MSGASVLKSTPWLVGGCSHNPGPGKTADLYRSSHALRGVAPTPASALPDAALPSIATIWRNLSRRGFVTPQPHKRPRSSYVRFEADMPNERWQADITHCRLADGHEVEIWT